MGVTIHFEGQLRDSADLDTLVQIVTDFANQRGWPNWPILENAKILHRVIDEEKLDYFGPTSGIGVEPDENAEPLSFEFDQHLYVQGYCKTQFAGAVAHMEVVALLRRLEPLFIELAVFDEAEYWDTGDPKRLMHHLDRVAEMIADEIRKDPTLRGPVRLPDGRILDLIN